MPRSFLDQLTQVAASATYDDAISNPHTVGVAEGQAHVEGDLNVIRTLMKDLLGETNWYDTAEMSINGIATKLFIQLLHQSGFDNVSVSGSSTTAFDTAIKTIFGHNDGGGNSTTIGVIVNGTLAHKLLIRDHTTGDPITDANNNEVYGRLSWNGTNYVVSFYSVISGVETAYNFSVSQALDLAFVSMSQNYENLSWERWLDFGFYDLAGFVGTVADTNITVAGMSYFLNGLTTQHAINLRVDELGLADTNNKGAHYVKINDSATGGSNGYFSGDNVQAAFNELKAQIAGATSTTYNFTNNKILADNDYIYPALNKLDTAWYDLATVNTSNKGANMVGVEDAALVFTATTVEGVLKELYDAIQDVTGWEKVSESTSSPINSGTAHTIPGSKTYTLASGANMDVYYDGQLLLEGTGNDYTEDTTTTIKFLFTVPANANLTFSIRK